MEMEMDKVMEMELGAGDLAATARGWRERKKM